jgi:uncharacterized protein YkwD
MQIPEQIGLRFCVVLALLAALALAPAGQTATTQTRVELSLVEAVNDVRDAHNLRPLRIDPALVRAARGYSATMLRRNVFEHGSFADRILRHGARGPALGENLAWGVGRRASARSIVGAWLNSPGHRENLLRPGWNRIGVGAVKGRFLGVRSATVVTADFAGR